MSTFVTLIRMTHSGRREITDSLGRGEIVKAKLAALNVSIRKYYATLGAYDFVFIFDAPDQKTMARALIEMGRLGAIETQTMAAIEEEDYTEVLKAISGG